MIGFDVSWGCFHALELLSAQQLYYIRIGFLAITLLINKDMEIHLLCINTFKSRLKATEKDGHNVELIKCLTIDAICNISSLEIYKALSLEFRTLLFSKRLPMPMVHKRLLVLLFHFYKADENMLPEISKYLRYILKLSKELSLQSLNCIVNVLCELCTNTPSKFLSLVPFLLTLFEQLESNWQLIKITKLLAKLIPVEKRLARKVIKPFVAVVKKSKAKSLTFECIRTLIVALKYSDEKFARRGEVYNLCYSCLLSDFATSTDANLSCLGFASLLDMIHLKRTIESPEQFEIFKKCFKSNEEQLKTKALFIIREIDLNIHALKNVLDGLIKFYASCADDNALLSGKIITTIISIVENKSEILLNTMTRIIDFLFNVVQDSALSPALSASVQNALFDICLKLNTTKQYCLDKCTKLYENNELNTTNLLFFALLLSQFGSNDLAEKLFTRNVKEEQHIAAYILICLSLNSEYLKTLNQENSSPSIFFCLLNKFVGSIGNTIEVKALQDLEPNNGKHQNFVSLPSLPLQTKLEKENVLNSRCVEGTDSTKGSNLEWSFTKSSKETNEKLETSKPVDNQSNVYKFKPSKKSTRQTHSKLPQVRNSIFYLSDDPETGDSENQLKEESFLSLHNSDFEENRILPTNGAKKTKLEIVNSFFSDIE